MTHLPPKVDVCDNRYVINASFVGGATPDPIARAPPTSACRCKAPRIRLQEASAKPQGRRPMLTFLGKPLGSWFGLTFGPPKPVYQAFTLGPATPDSVPTPPAPSRPSRSRRLPTSRRSNSHRHAFASLCRMMDPCCGMLFGLPPVVALFGAGDHAAHAAGRQLLDRASIALRAGRTIRITGRADAARHAGPRQVRRAATPQGLKLGAPVLRAHLQARIGARALDGEGRRYQLFATYPICLWSGRLGPKLREGDRQAPEGFYTVTKDELNPNSRWHRSFNLGFPNAFDRAHDRTGSFIMVHGGCLSIGCFAMTNDVVR